MDPAERRGCRFQGPLEGNRAGAQKPVYMSTLQQRIAELAREQPEMGFTSLAHLLDIPKFFDTIDHGHLRDFLKRRVQDGVLQQLIGKWLHAGVLEDGCVTHPEQGSPQGGVVSPILSNIFLHDVLDEWFEREVPPRLKGRSFLIRYADDFVMGFSREEDARRVMEVLPKRFEKYGLTIHPEKTRLVPFERPGGDPVGTDP